MSDKPSFKHEVFISYSQDDNLPEIEGQEGWIDTFEKRLSVKLLHRCGKMAGIWRDQTLGRAQMFDQAIRDAAVGSAIFMPLVTPGYLMSEYCRQEMDWFCEQAEEDGTGLFVMDYLRVFPILLYNIPHHEWPAECRGTSAFMFHDAEGDEFGEPLAPESREYNKQLRVLVDDICVVLTELRERATRQTVASPDGPRTPGTPFKVFVACPADDLRPARRQIAAALAKKEILLSNDIPPPYDRDQHERAAIDAIREADLSVHLLGSLAGEPLDSNAPDRTYTLEQARLGLENARSQLVLIPDDVVLDDIDNVPYRRFMDELRTWSRDASRLEVVRIGHHQMPDEILAKKHRLEEADQRDKNLTNGNGGIAFIDLHMRDLNYAQDLVAYLNSQDIAPVMIPEAGFTPKTAMSLFEENLKRSRLFIIVFGTAARDWVEQRLNEALKLALSHQLLTQIGVYVAPPHKPQADVSFPTFVETMINMTGFDPNTLDRFLRAGTSG